MIWGNSGIRGNADEDGDLTMMLQRLTYAWGAVFADDRFWHQWWVDRQDVYQVGREQVAEARQRTQRFWIDKLRTASESGLGSDVPHALIYFSRRRFEMTVLRLMFDDGVVDEMVEDVGAYRADSLRRDE